jgi:hypothetical protein
MVKSGEKIKLYSKSVVSPYDNCEKYSKEILCDNGYFIGNEIYRFPHCEKNLDCQLPDGTIIKNNESRITYNIDLVPYNKRGENCLRHSLERFCKNGDLSGPDEYRFSNCKINYDNSCRLKDGTVIANNQVFYAYKKNKVA